MLRLTESELDNALHAVEGHGYGDFFPEPPELALVKSNWDAIRGTLGQIDLDIYDGYPVLAAFAPKSRVNVRRVALLHPYDLIFYTALVLAVRDGLSQSRQAAGGERAVRDGDPGVTRTRNLEFRKLSLYPVELRGQRDTGFNHN